MKSVVKVGAFVFGAAVALSACGGPPSEADLKSTLDLSESKLVEEAKSEGSLTIYGAPAEPLGVPLAQGFQEKYGIKTTYVRLSSDDLETRFKSEVDAGAPQASVLIRSAAEYWFWDEGLESGIITSLDDANVPGWPDGYDEDWLVAPGIPTVLVQQQGLAINAEAVPEAERPTSWKDLADPKWRGRLGINPALSGPGQLPPWTMLLDEYGPDWLKAVGKNAKTMFDTASPMAEAVSSGAVDLVMPISTASTAEQIEAGAPVASTTLDQAFGLEYGLGIVTDGPSPAAASLFASYMLAGEGAKVLQDVKGTHVAVNVDGPLGDLPEDYHRFERGYEKRAEEVHQLLGVAGEAKY